MEKELFPMKIIERRTVDGDLNSRKSKQNRRKSDRKEDVKLYNLMESVYMSNGIIFTDSFERISEKTEKHDYLDVEYSRLVTQDKNYIIQNGTFVIVLDNLVFFEDASFDNTRLEEIISSANISKMELFVYNGSWWVKKDQAFKDVEYKWVRGENTLLEDLKEIPKGD